MKKYVSYENEIQGTYTESEMKQIYINQVDKTEYHDYEDWLLDMLRSGVFEMVK